MDYCIAMCVRKHWIRTKRGCTWSQNAICRILDNELYTGKVINGKQEVTDFLTGKRTEKDETEWMVVERPDLRIIEPEIYEKAKEVRAAKAKSFHLTSERESNKYLFSTLIKCKECGWSFRRIVRKYKNTYIRWGCSGHNGRGADSCPNAQKVDEDDLISREELNDKIGGRRKEIERLENEMNNLQLKRIIQKIEVDKDGNVDVYLRLLDDLGLDETVLISNDHTQSQYRFWKCRTGHAVSKKCQRYLGKNKFLYTATSDQYCNCIRMGKCIKSIIFTSANDVR